MRPPLSAQVRGHLRAQLGDAERLADVVVGTKSQPVHGVLLGHLGGEEEDGGVHKAPDASHQLEAVHLGHHHVAQDEIVARKIESEHKRGIVYDLDDVSVAHQRAREQVGDRLVVVDGENPCHVPSPPRVLSAGPFQDPYHRRRPSAISPVSSTYP